MAVSSAPFQSKTMSCPEQNPKNLMDSEKGFSQRLHVFLQGMCLGGIEAWGEREHNLQDGDGRGVTLLDSTGGH